MSWDPTNLILILSGKWSRTALVFKNGIKPKEIKTCIFGDISSENLIETVLHNTSLPCYKTKRFVKKTVLWKFTKLTLVTSFKVNELFPASMCWSNTWLVKAFPHTCLGFLAACFISIYKIERYLVNISKY